MSFVRNNQLKVIKGREVVRKADLTSAEIEKFSLKSIILAFKEHLQQFNNQLPTMQDD